MMLTPQRRRGWAGWSTSPKVCSSQENGSAAQRMNSADSEGVILGRGKGLTEMEAAPVPPPQLLLSENDNELVGGSGVSEDLRRFRELELLNERLLPRKDSEALSERVFAIERERDECLYNLGLLLIEKKEWSSKIEELRQALVESQEFLKSDQESHKIFVTDLEKREQELKKALGVEKQCVVDLEKALHDMHVEIAETKFISEKRIVDAHALEAKLEEKEMVIEAKGHAAEAKLAEGNRMNSEIARKLDDFKAREYKLQRDISSLNIERKTLEADASNQRGHLREWENEMQEKQRRLLNEQRLLNEREERANELDRILKKKQDEIEEARKKIDAAGSILKSQENDFKIRSRGLIVKERDTDIKSSNLERKEKDLMALEEKLNVRESEEIQKLLDEHNTLLDAKKQEFELEMGRERRSFDEDVKSHMDMLDKEKRQVRCKEEQLIKREEALEKKNDTLKDKEENLDTKSKALKKWEDSLKTDENKLQEERKQLFKDSSELEASRAKLHDEKAVIEAMEQKVVLERENLKITQQEREHHLKLQAALKLEKEEYLMMLDTLEKEKEVLRKEREMFERDWEVLDEKRDALELELKQLSTERDKLNKWRHHEEERLKNEIFQARTGLQRDLEDLRLKKETFEKTMTQDRAEVQAEVDRKHAGLTREFELLKHELEMNVQRRLDDAEKKLKEKENVFERWREMELSHIKSSSESNGFELKRLEVQQNLFQREKDEFSDQRKKLEIDRKEIRNDADTLVRLSRNLKDQRQGFAKEKELFLSVVEQCKTCHNCGVPINKIDRDLLPLRATEGSEEILLPSLADDFLEEHTKDAGTVMTPGDPVVGSTNSGSHMARWFKKCSNLFRVSSPKNVHSHNEDRSETSFGERLDSAALEEDADNELALSADHFFENQVNLDNGNVVGEPDRVDKTGEDAEASFDLADSSIDIVRTDRDDIAQKSVVAIDDETNEMQGSSIHAENDSQPESSKQRLRLQPSRRGKLKTVRRTNSVKAVVEEAKSILGESSEEIKMQQNGDSNKFQNFSEENQGASVQADQAVSEKGKKRRLSELEPEGSEAHSVSVSLGGRSKRRQTSSLLPAPGDKRYNFRRSTVANTSTTSKATSHQKKEKAEIISCNYPQPSGAFKYSENLLENSVAVPNVLEVDSEKIDQTVESAQCTEQSAKDGVEVDKAASPDMEITSDDEITSSDDDDDLEKQHTASIGKKIWHFLTT